FLDRSTYFADRHLDANHRPGMACPAAYSQRMATWACGCPAISADHAVLPLWRSAGRPLAETHSSAIYTIIRDTAGLRALDTRRQRDSAALARTHIGELAWTDEFTGYADSPGFCGRNGGTRRPAQCYCPELLAVQYGTH